MARVASSAMSICVLVVAFGMIWWASVAPARDFESVFDRAQSNWFALRPAVEHQCKFSERANGAIENQQTPVTGDDPFGVPACPVVPAASREAWADIVAGHQAAIERLIEKALSGTAGASQGDPVSVNALQDFVRRAAPFFICDGLMSAQPTDIERSPAAKILDATLDRWARQQVETDQRQALIWRALWRGLREGKRKDLSGVRTRCLSPRKQAVASGRNQRERPTAPANTQRSVQTVETKPIDARTLQPFTGTPAPRSAPAQRAPQIVAAPTRVPAPRPVAPPQGERPQQAPSREARGAQPQRVAAQRAVPEEEAPAPRGIAREIPDQVWARMRGVSWKPNYGCPARGQLALLSIPYWDFEGRRQVGRMVVAANVAEDVLDIFADLYAMKFQIARMELVDAFGANDDRSMNANNTSAFNCRKTTGGSRLSEHSYGKAIDINPVQNPYVTRRGTVLPRRGRPYATPAQRSQRATAAGIIHRLRQRRVIQAFARRGWKWGGNWRSLKDYQHFSVSGR